MSSDNIKVMTYNIHSTIGTDGVADWRRIAGIIRNEQPDVLGLEEVTISHGRSPDVDVPKCMSEYLGMNVFFGRTMAINQGRGHYGIAAFSPHRLEVVEKLVLPTPEGIEPRTTVIVRVLDDRPYYFVVTHFSFGGEFEGDEAYRTIGAKLITDTIKDKNYFPVIWVGDFNTFTGTKTIDYVHKHWDVCNDRAPDTPTTETSHNGWRQIDFICCGPKGAFEVREFAIIDNLIASDHKPVTARLKFRPS